MSSLMEMVQDAERRLHDSVERAWEAGRRADRQGYEAALRSIVDAAFAIRAASDAISTLHRTSSRRRVSGRRRTLIQPPTRDREA